MWLCMFSQYVICFLRFGVGQRVGAMLFKPEFTTMWIEVDSGYSVASFRGKAVKHTGPGGYFPG